MTSRSNSNYKVGKMQAHSVMYALVKKELKRFTSSIAYIMNVGMGMFLAVIGSVVCVFVGIDKVLQSMQIPTISQEIVYAVPFGIAMMLTMTCTTSISLSLERKNLWIIKSLPIEESMIYKSKMAFNLLLLIPAAIICNICFAIAMKLDIIMIVLYFLVTASAIFFSTTFGMLLGQKFANFEWENEIEVIKQGAASAMCIFKNMVVQLVLAGLTIFLTQVIDGKVPLLVIAILVSGISFLFYRRVIKIK